MTDRDPLRAALAEALPDVHKPDWHPGMLWTDVYEQWADRILAHPAILAALAGSEPAGLREVLANLDREVEAYARLEAEDAARKEWALADRWRYMASGVAQAVEAVRQYVPALAATPTASPTDHEHYWVDAPDDETGWHCTICGLTEYPGDPGIGLAASPTATGERDPA